MTLHGLKYGSKFSYFIREKKQVLQVNGVSIFKKIIN